MDVPLVVQLRSAAGDDHHAVDQPVSSATTYRRPAFILAAGIFPPLVGSIVYESGIMYVPGYDPNPPLFNLSGYVVAFIVYHFDLLRLTPIRLDQILDKLPQAIVVQDPNNVMLYKNQAASDLFELHSQDIFAEGSTTSMGRRVEFVGGGKPILLEFSSPSDQQVIRKRQIDLVSSRDTLNGKVVFFEDITEQKKLRFAEQRAEAEETQRQVVDLISEELNATLVDLDDDLRTAVDLFEKNDPNAALRLLSHTRAKSASSAIRLRREMLSIRSRALFGGGSAERLGQFLEELSALSGIPVQYSLPDDPLDGFLTIDIFATMIELIQNRLSYAAENGKATHAQIMVVVDNASIIFTYIDDCKEPWQEFPQRTEPFVGRSTPLIEYRATPRGTHMMVRFPSNTVPLNKFPELIQARVLMCEPKILFAEALSGYLRSIEVVPLGNVSAAELFADAKKLKMDIFLIASDQFEEVYSLLHSRSLGAGKVILIGEARSDMDLSRLRAKVDGWISYEEDTENLKKAFASVLRGGLYFNAEIINRLLSPSNTPELVETRLIAQGLSDRQIAILRAVVSGKVYKKIAMEIGISESAVKYHVYEIQKALKVSDRVELIDLAKTLGFE